jgi:RHS repeat-associated protein
MVAGLTAVQIPAAAPALAGTAATLLAPTTMHADGAELAWTKYGLAAGETFASYEVHRSTTAGFTPSTSTRLTTIRDIDATTWRDTTAKPSTAFSYRIVANGLVSNEQRVTMAATNRTVKILQPDGARGESSYLLRYASASTCLNDWNYGSSTILRIGTSVSGYTHRPVLRFDLRDIPAGATVNSATLNLTYAATANPGAAINVHRLLQPWEEGTGTGQCNAGGVSWNETERGVRWKTGGAAFDATVEYQLPAKARTTAGTDAYPLAGLVKKWVDGAPNDGLLLKIATDIPPSTTSSPWFDYSSDDAATASARPKLTVDYTDFSTATGPRAAVVSPTPGSIVRGTVALSAAAGDDRRVDKVEFFVDGGTTPVATDLSPPWQGSWNTTTATAGAHTITARATDDTGQQKTSAGTAVTVDNSAKPTGVTLTAPAGGSSLANTVTMTASASDDVGVAYVDFYVDDHVVGSDSSYPYSVPWNTLDPLNPAVDGSHQVKARAYDGGGQWTDSATLTVTTANTNGTQYQASYDLNQLGPSDDPFAIPPLNAGNELATPIDVYSGSTSLRDLSSTPYDSAADYSGGLAPAAPGNIGDTIEIPPPDRPKSVNAFQCEVTVTNDSTVAWKGDDLRLWYRWYTLDGTILFEGMGTDYFPQTVQPGQSKRIPITVEPPALPQGIDMSQVRLRFDIYDYGSTAANKWFTGRGNPPVDNPVVVDRLLDNALGLERFWQYEADEAGAGMAALTNVANGNMLLRWSPFFAPGRGLATMVDLTYNSLEDHSKSPAGNNVSVSISGLTRLGEPLDIHPNNADTISGKSNKYVVLTDGDGTTHKFTGTTNGDGTTTWTEPPGVNLYLRTTTDPNPARRWALTRPDNVTFYYDPDGFPTAVVDRNGNTLTFTLEDTPPGEDPGGPKRRIITVADAAGRTFGIDYYSRAEAKKAHVRGKIQRITDHSGSALDFEYYDDGNLRRLIQRGGVKANGTPLADRAFVFTYTTSNGAGPAITDPTLRVDPDPHTPNQSTRIYSVRDPNNAETRFEYYGPGSNQLRWKLKSRTNRNGNVTNFSYDITNRRTTVDAPLSRDTEYVYDTTGKVTSIVDPAEQTTQVQWTSDFKVGKVTEPSLKFTTYTYNHNGYLTSVTDQLNNRTDLTYLNRQLDSRDALGHWSLLSTLTTPRGTATATAGDFQWRFTYDPPGNVDLVTDPADFVSNYDWNLAGSTNPGTISKVTDNNGGVTTFDYDPSGQPSRITDPVNRVVQLGYDVDGQMIWMQDPNHTGDSGSDVRAYRTYFDYDTFHRLGRQSSPKSTQFDRGRIIWSSADYDPNDNVVKQIDPHYGGTVDDGEDGPVRTARYDAMDQLTEQANPDKTVDPLGERYRYDWDAAGRPVKLTKPKGVLSATVDDFASAYTYDVLDRIVRQVDYGTSTTDARYVHMCYDVAGDLRSVTSPRAGLTSLTCPGNGPATASFTTVYDYDAAHRPLKQRDPLGHESRFTYDENSNVTSVERDIDTAASPVRIERTQLSWDERDLRVRSEELFDQSTGRELVTLLEYDGNRNVIREIKPRAYDDANGSGTYTNYVTKYVYDKADQLVRRDLPFDSRDGSERQYEHRSYDGNGNLAWISLPVTNSDPVQVADTARTRMTYWDPRWIRTSDSPSDPKVSFDYAAQGFQTRRAPDKKGQPGVEDDKRVMLWAFYDDAMLKERDDLDGNPSTYKYDADNMLTSALDASGVHGADDSPMQTEAIYTGFDEPLKVRHKHQKDTTWTFTRYRYDPNGNADRRFENGKETGADINTATQTAAPREYRLSYDEADWLTEQLDLGTDSACKDDSRTVTSFWATGWERTRRIYRGDASCTADPATWKQRQATTWDHFNNGKLKTLTTTAYKTDGSSEVTEKHDVGYFEGSRYENGHRTTDSYIRKRADGDSQTTCVGPTPCLADFDYDAREKVIKHQKRAGAVDTYTLDEPGKLIGDTTIRAGNVTTENDEGTQVSRRYEANQVKELTVGTSTASYVYDNYGNVDCVVNGAGGTSCPSGGTGLVADYAYDNLDRMVSQKTYGTPGTATDTADYTYDAMDRVTKEVEGHEGTADDRTTNFTFQGLSNLVTEEKQSGGSNPKTKTFSYDAYGHRIAMSNKDNATGQTETFTYGTDVQGSVSQLITEAGGVKASYGYSAYGTRDAALSTGDLNDKAPLNPYRFMNKRLDPGSATTNKPANSVDMGSRRYGVDTGRFLQQDIYANALGNLGLALDPLSQNTYALAGGNPVSFVEVDGHMVIADGGGGGSTTPNPTTTTTTSGSADTTQKTADGTRDNPALRRVNPERDPGLWGLAANVSDYVIGPLEAAPSAVGDWGSYAGKFMHSRFSWVRKASSKFLTSLSQSPKMTTIGRFARSPVGTWGGRALGVVGAGLSFMKHRAEGDQVFSAAAKTGIEVGTAFAGAKIGALTGAAIGSIFPGPGTAIGAFVGGAVGAFAGAFGAGKLMDSGVGDAVENAADKVQNFAGDVASDIGDAIGGLFD